MSPKGPCFHHNSKTFPQLSHFPSSRLLGRLDFLQVFQMVPRVAVSVVNSRWVQFCIVFPPTLPRMRSAESTVLCIPTTISHDCEVERTIINSWMQNKCGKFMQISTRSHLFLGRAVVRVLFMQWENSFLAISFSSCRGTFNLNDASAKWWSK